jgi:hypothetical protein
VCGNAKVSSWYQWNQWQIAVCVIWRDTASLIWTLRTGMMDEGAEAKYPDDIVVRPPSQHMVIAWHAHGTAREATDQRR